MSNPSTFGFHLKRLRQEHGLTQDTLAERVGCATQTIRKIEGGQRRPSYQIAARLAQELGIAADERARFIRSSRHDLPEAQVDLPAPAASETQLATSGPAQNNLPIPLTRLLGREQELISARAFVLRQGARLLTLVGPGGAGKTRLSIEVAAGLEDHFADGIVFVNLVPIRDAGLVVTTIADAVGIGEEGGRPRLERLKDGLRSKQLLLVLDNFEQVIPAAPLLADLLSSCPGLVALVTSREVLRIRGEQVFAVPPLPLPDTANGTAGDVLSQYAAVQLFAERAAAVRPGFAVTNANAPAIAELCRRLDGLPLAIELAAARSTLFQPQEILALLESRLKLLTGGPRDLPARQQALRNTIAWSYELLTDSEQALFRRLCVFSGERTLEAITAVCSTPGALEFETIEGLASLVDKSLLCQAAPASGQARFLLLETIREYGLEQLERSGEAAVTRRAHAYYYLQLVERTEPHLWGGAQVQSLDRLEHEHDNLRAALAWHIAHDEGVEPALRMAGRLWRFWDMRGHWTEGQLWLDQALSRRASADPAHTWIALHGAGNLSSNLGEYARARAYYEESLAVTQSLDLQYGIANSLLNLSLVSFHQGDIEPAIRLQEESLAIHRRLGNSIGVALALENLASMLERQGQYNRAAALAEESLARSKDLRDSRGMALALHQLGILAHRGGAFDRAGALLEQCQTIYEQLGDKNDLARVLNNLGELAGDQQQYGCARARYAESLRLATELGDRRCQAAVLNNLGRLAHHSGDQERALALCDKSLSMQRELGDKRGVAIALESLRQIGPQPAAQQRDSLIHNVGLAAAKVLGRSI